MKRILPLQSWLVAALLATAAGARGVDLYLHAEQFKWTEDDTDGRRLLTEEGPVYGVGVTAAYPLGDAMEAAGRLEGFFGEVDYDGETQIGEPVKTTTEYYGVLGELDLRLPFAAAERLRLAPFAGLGTRAWLRRLDNTGVDSGGYDEQWLSAYGRAGLRATWTASDRNQVFAEAALRLPFYNTMRASLDFDGDGGGGDVSLEPGSEWTVAAEIGATLGTARISLFYEQLAFSRSEIETVPPFDFFQPDSDGQIIGLRLGLEF